MFIRLSTKTGKHPVLVAVSNISWMIQHTGDGGTTIGQIHGPDLLVNQPVDLIVDQLNKLSIAQKFGGKA